MYKVLDFTVNHAVLECWICHLPPKPRRAHLYLCDSGHVFCGLCTRAHMASCGGSSSSGRCRLLEDFVSRVEIKCACGGYFRCSKLVDHQHHCPLTKISTPVWNKCRVKAKFVLCSICGVTLQTPVFKGGFYDRLVCGDCHHADTNKNGFTRCHDVEYLFKNMMVKTLRPFISRPDEDETNKSLAGNNSIIGETKGKAPSKLETGKNVAETALKTSAYNKKANVAMTSGKKTDEYESNRLPAGNSVIVGKTKGTTPSKVCKMDNHVDVVESDGDSSDDIHPETAKRVAETALEASAYNKKAKIVTPSGQKTEMIPNCCRGS